MLCAAAAAATFTRRRRQWHGGEGGEITILIFRNAVRVHSSQPVHPDDLASAVHFFFYKRSHGNIPVAAPSGQRQLANRHVPSAATHCRRSVFVGIANTGALGIWDPTHQK
ncbi:hypothetical protein EYF80_001755 [Liparis tanakae]|uniref:Uncharacterized protein n=1 Tax=Liparis tanakae TaxID=230148 RepID=A0A4Z2JCQ0_9TELE|nr:hypothetical protein EYF80_001755 [Liparis tanakae]